MFRLMCADVQCTFELETIQPIRILVNFRKIMENVYRLRLHRNSVENASLCNWESVCICNENNQQLSSEKCVQQLWLCVIKLSLVAVHIFSAMFVVSLSQTHWNSSFICVLVFFSNMIKMRRRISSCCRR